MSRAPGIHVVPDGDDWKIVIGYRYPTQETALPVARLIADVINGELHTHGEDGQIRAKDSHGNDPSDVPG